MVGFVGAFAYIRAEPPCSELCHCWATPAHAHAAACCCHRWGQQQQKHDRRSMQCAGGKWNRFAVSLGYRFFTWASSCVRSCCNMVTQGRFVAGHPVPPFGFLFPDQERASHFSLLVWARSKTQQQKSENRFQLPSLSSRKAFSCLDAGSL